MILDLILPKSQIIYILSPAICWIPVWMPAGRFKHWKSLIDRRLSLALKSEDPVQSPKQKKIFGPYKVNNFLFNQIILEF